MITTYPTSEDYIRVVQSPKAAFSTPRLQQAHFTVDPYMQIPMPASGTRAVVFRADVGGEDRALRFYTVEEDADTRRRYADLGRALTKPSLLPHVATAAWIDEAITVRQRRWPMVEMQWVEGRTLDTYVNFLAGDRHRGALGTLAGEWRELIATLQRAKFAHGDLQHGNVLVDTQRKLRLVDFDGSWLESFSANMIAPAEVGHPNYQRANRAWGRWMDTFPGLVVYTALLGLSLDGGDWSADWTEDKILFDRDDFVPPFRTPTWQRLAAIGDPQVARAIAVLKHCCEPTWAPSGSLEDLLTETIELPHPRASKAAPPAGTPWWVLTGAASPQPEAERTPPQAPPATPLPPLPPIEVPMSSGSGTGGTGTTPNLQWHAPPPRQPQPPAPHWPQTPPQAPLPSTRQPQSWPASIGNALLSGLGLALIVIIACGIIGVTQGVVAIGATAGAVFALLMLFILRLRS